MSIRSDAYQLCKKIQTSYPRYRIKDTLLNINTVHEKQRGTENDRGSFGYAARQMRAQVLGYLIVDRDKETISESFPPLKWCAGLHPEERSLLESVHKSFADLNNACLDELLRIFPQFRLALDPYEQFRYEISADIVSADLLAPKEFEKMARSFRQHRAFKIVTESYEIIQDKLPENTESFFRKLVAGFEKQLSDSGPLTTRRDIADSIYMSPPNSELRLTYRFISALLSIRTSLEILDELLFQAILTNKLPILNENNIVEFGPLTGHASGNGLALVVQPGETVGLMDIGLVLVKDKSVEFPLDLFYIEVINYQASNELGDTLELHLREINENLNRFSRLLDHL